MRKILVAEDNAAVGGCISLLLITNGFEIVSASNGEKAFSILSEHPDISLIVLDLEMPYMNGYEFLKSKRNGHLASIPVVIFTANHKVYVDGEQVRAVLVKPIQQDEIVHTISNVLQKLELEKSNEPTYGEEQ